MGAILAVLRAAIPFAATIFGGYFVSDVFNERQKAKQAQAAINYPQLIGKSFKSKGGFWKFLAIGSLAVGGLVFIIQKFLSK